MKVLNRQEILDYFGTKWKGKSESDTNKSSRLKKAMINVFVYKVSDKYFSHAQIDDIWGFVKDMSGEKATVRNMENIAIAVINISRKAEKDDNVKIALEVVRNEKTEFQIFRNFFDVVCNYEFDLPNDFGYWQIRKLFEQTLKKVSEQGTKKRKDIFRILEGELPVMV